jgi:diguanylate cyclase (GGDEF)-like protein/PAS domain S-box-containing protein
MIRVSPPIRISFGLVLLTLSVLLIGDMLGFVPDETNLILKSRATISESLAIQVSTAISNRQTSTVTNFIEAIARRNEDILSISIRQKNGKVLAVYGDHEANWPKDLDLDGKSTSSHIQIPLFLKRNPWGLIEIAFKPLNAGGLAAIYQHPLFKMILFAMFSCFVGYLLFIKKTLKELDPSKAIPDRVKTTLNLLAEGVVILDEKGQILLANSNFASKVFLSENQLIGKNIADMEWEDPRTSGKPDDLPWRQSMRDNVNCNGIPLILKTKNSMSAFMVNSSPILDAGNNVRGAIATFDDVTKLEKRNSELAKSLNMLKRSRAEIQRKNQELEVLASRDGLTGLLNRRAFFDEFEIAFNETAAQNKELCCIMLDIDHFKAVNDNHGHQKGDEVLKSVAAVISSSVRGADMVGRYGGEEFCIFTPDTNISKAVGLAERIRKDIEENAYPSLHVTSSFGVSSNTSGVETANELVNQADEMLYLSKEQGRNRVSSWASRDQLMSIIEDGATQDKHELQEPLENALNILTGQSARDQLIVRLEESVISTVEEGKIGAILLMGLDRFGRINETLGHTVGDAVLDVIRHRLAESFRTTDSIIDLRNGTTDITVSHITGDEFAVVLTELDSVETISHVVRRTLDLVSKTIEVEGHEFYITSSIGISVFPEDGDDPAGLLKNATVALNQAKSVGGNTLQFYNSNMDKDASMKLKLESHLHRAIEREEFVVFYQPKIDAKTGMINSFEALIRWDHPEIGMISPGLFIPIAEEDGLISPIGKWVLKKSIEQVRAWRQMGYANMSVAFNLAARQFQQDDIFEEITTIVRENNGEPSWLEIEVTEGGLMTDMDRAARIIKQFRDLGFSIAIDDFGTGYSSLNYIKKFDLTTLKIDRSFVKDLRTSGQDRYIVTAIVNLARTMDLKVVAEGVETQEQLEFMRKVGCDEIQGFFYSPPVPADKATSLLSEYNNVEV